MRKGEGVRPVMNVKDWLSSLSKHEPSDVLTRFIALVDLHADQMRFGAEPVDSADPAFPTAAHTGAALLVCFGNTTLCFGALAECSPLLRSHTGHERRVHRIEDVEVRQRCGGLRLALTAAFADKEARR